MSGFSFPTNPSTSSSSSPFPSLFGAPAASSSLFGAPASSSSLFGAQAASSSLFGAPAASSSSPSPFSSSSSLFSSPNPSFGAPASSTRSFLLSANAASSAPAPSFGFGASSTPASSSLFSAPAASSTPASSSLFGTPAASSTPASSFLFGTSAASSTPASSSLFGAPAASSSPFGASSVFGSSSGSGFSSNLFGSSSSVATSTTASTTTTTSSISSTFFRSSSSNYATPSPAFASLPFGASSSSSASSTSSFSNLFGYSSSSSSSASPFSSRVSPSPFSGSTSAFSTQSAPAFSFPSTAGSSAASTSPFSFSSSAAAPSFSTSNTTASPLFTASSSATSGFSFPTGSSSISPSSSLFAASSSSVSAAAGFSFPTGSSSTFASSSAPAFSFPTGSNPAFSVGVDAVVVMTVEKRDEEAVPKPIDVGLVTVTTGLETEAVVVDVAEATFPNPREDGKPDEDVVPKEKPLDEELDVAEGVGEETATDAELPVPFDIENTGLEPVGNQNPGIAELPVPFDSENDEELDVAEGVGDVSTPGASTVTSGIAFPSFGACSSSTTTTTATSTTVSFPSFGTRSTAAPPGTTGLSFSLSTKTPTTASASHPQSAALLGPASTSAAGTTSSTSSAAQLTSALAVVSCSGTTSTVSAAIASSPKLPSEITGKTVEEVDDDEDDIPLVAKSPLQAKSCTITLTTSRPVDHPTVIVDEVESATCKSTTLTVPIRKPMSPHDDCVSLDADDSLSDVGSKPIIGAAKAPLRSTTDSGGLNAHADVPEVHGSPRVEMEGESISPAAHADHGGSGSALVNCNIALDPPPSRGNLSDPCVDFHPPRKDSAEPSSAREGISIKPSGGAIRDGQVGMTSKVIFLGATDDTHAPESLDFSLLGRFADNFGNLTLSPGGIALFDTLFSASTAMSHPTDMANHPDTPTFVQPHAAVQTARIAASTTIATSQEMPHGSTSGSAPICTSLPSASTGPQVSPLVTSKVAPSRSSFDLSGGLASWRGFKVSPFSLESLERLFTRFPQMLDRFQLGTSNFQTFVLDRLAGLGDEMHDMLVSEVQETDLGRLKCIIGDLSIVGIDVSFFRDRLDVVASARRTADLSLAIAMHRHEHAMHTRELLRVESATKDLRIKLEKMESVAKDLRAILTKNEQARDAAIADLEALYTSSAQLDPSLSLDQGLL